MPGPLDEVMEIINSKDFQKDYKNATEKKLKAPANRSKKAIQELISLMEKAKDQMDTIRKG